MALTLHQPKIDQTRGETCVQIGISGHAAVEFRIRGNPPITPSPVQLGNLCIAIGLLPAMRMGSDLKIEAPVCPRFLANAHTLIQIFHRWFRDPAFETIEIFAETADDESGGDGVGVGCFFSGGVDSLHSVQQHREELTALIFVHGFDIPSDDVEQAALVRQHLEPAAEAIGIPLVEIWTDLRKFSDDYCYWGQHYFGAALASIAHLLSPQLGRAYIPGSCAYEMLEPWGSHALSDPLWSSACLELVHDGAAFSRMEKVEAIAHWEIAQRFLRVCWAGPPGSYNCGRCEKCIRTMAALRLTGQLDRFSVFEAPLDLDQLAGQRAPHPAFVPMAEDMWQLATTKDSDPELAAALETSVRGTRAEITLKHFAKNNADALATDHWQRLLPKIRNKLFRSIADSDPEWFVQRLEKILPGQRQAILELLHEKDPKWLRKSARSLRRK